MDKLPLQITNIDCDVDKIISSIKTEKIQPSKFPSDVKYTSNEVDEITSKRKRKKSKVLLEMIDGDWDGDEIDDTLKRKDCKVSYKKSKKLLDSDSDYNAKTSISKAKKPNLPSKILTEMHDGDTDYKEKTLLSKTKNSKIPRQKPTIPHNNVPKFNEMASTSNSKQSKVSPTKSVELISNDSADDGIDIKCEEKVSKTPANKISAEMKKMIIDALESGVCNRKNAAAAFNLPYATVVTIYKKFLKTGSVGRKKKEEKVQEEHIQFILDTLAENCTFSIKELTEMVKSKYDLQVHYVSVSKKIPAFHYNLNRIQDISKIDMSEEVINDHKQYCQLFLELINSKRPMIYVDETEFTVLMRRFSGRIEPGQPGQVTAPSLRTRHKVIMASMVNDEILLYKTLDNQRSRVDLFNYLKELFGVVRKNNIKSAVLVLGNSNFIYQEEIQIMTQMEGHQLLFLPINSKYFNPIELMFSQLSAIIRSKNPNNETQLEQLIDTFPSCINGQQCHCFCNQIIDNINKFVANN